MKESDIQSATRIALSQAGATIFRNNVGKLLDKNGRLVQFGLCVGSSDLIGWTPVTITSDMVGSTIAVFTAIECKTAIGQPTDAQVRFLAAVRAHGGRAGIARSGAEAVAIAIPAQGPTS